ncbi:MAG: hypothetical protein U0O33_04525 [Blautia sp.]|nr:hypothetical protein [uncultured Blautia sp.]
MKNMKKVIAGLLLVTVLCGVTACGDNNTTNNKNDTETIEDRKDTNRDDGIIEDTGREIKDGVEDLGDDIRDGVDNMGDSIEDNGNNAVNDSNAGKNGNQ